MMNPKILLISTIVVTLVSACELPKAGSPKQADSNSIVGTWLSTCSVSGPTASYNSAVTFDANGTVRSTDHQFANTTCTGGFSTTSSTTMNYTIEASSKYSNTLHFTNIITIPGSSTPTIELTEEYTQISSNQVQSAFKSGSYRNTDGSTHTLTSAEIASIPVIVWTRQ